MSTCGEIDTAADALTPEQKEGAIKRNSKTEKEAI